MLLMTEMTDLLVKTIKTVYLEENLKRILQNCNQLKENYLSNKSKHLEKIIELLIPVNDDKLQLYYRMFKAINQKIENDEKNENLENIKINKNKHEVVKNKINVGKNDNISNCNVSTNLSSHASNFMEHTSHNDNISTILDYLENTKNVRDDDINMRENYDLLKNFETKSKTDKSMQNSENCFNGIITANPSFINSDNFHKNSHNFKSQKDFNSWGYTSNNHSTCDKNLDTSLFNISNYLRLFLR